MWKILKKLGYDIIPVIIGILIALFLNNLREDIQQKKLIKGTLIALLHEHQQNIEELDITLKRQEEFRVILEENIKNDSLKFFEIIKKAKGFRTPDLHHTSWESLVYNNKQNLDFEIVSLLSMIDKYHQIADKRSDNMMLTLYSKDFFSTDNQVKVLFRVNLLDLMEVENRIKRDYLKLREVLEKKGIKLEIEK